MMKTLCIIPCGSKKIWDKYPDLGPQKARDVYIGPFAKKCREYAETFYGESFCILSAKSRPFSFSILYQKSLRAE